MSSVPARTAARLTTRRRAGALARLAGVLLACGTSPLAAQAGSPAGPVPVELLRARREALAARLGTGVAVLRSAEARDLETDYPQDSDYRERNEFFYLTGLEAPGSWLVLAADSGALADVALYLPARDPASERWTGTRLGADEAAALSGIAAVRDAATAREGIRAAALGFTSPARRGALFLDRNVASRRDDLLAELVFSARRDQAVPPVRALLPEVAALRLVKDADELRRQRRAVEITTEAIVEAAREVRPGMWEYELEGAVEGGFRRRGAERVGFPSIVGSGPNSTTLHYDKSRRRMEAGDLVVLDVGAEFGYFTADVTRTLPVSGRFTPRQRRIYELVLGAQQAAMDAVRPGVTMGDLTRIARTWLKDHSGDACGAKSCDQYFIHGLGHWLGMDVHDVGDYRTPLQPGAVITIEPGIYLPEEHLGVRIEDDVLVTPTGHELLSAGAPRRAEDVEKMMQGRKTAAR